MLCAINLVVAKVAHTHRFAMTDLTPIPNFRKDSNEPSLPFFDPQMTCASPNSHTDLGGSGCVEGGMQSMNVEGGGVKAHTRRGGPKWHFGKWYSPNVCRGGGTGDKFGQFNNLRA